ncbi:DUF5666 domain-containing protein [Pseudomonadota bacterium]
MKNLLIINMLVVAVAGCNSGSESSSELLPVASNKISGSVDSLSYTEKTLSVNGYHLDATNAEINYESMLLSLNTVTTGMHVKVDASNESASTIRLNPAFTGQVSSVNGDSISINDIEFTFPELNAEIAAGDWVMVSAQMQADGSWKVRSIDKFDSLLVSEAEGRVKDLDPFALTFKVGNLVVDYSLATLEDIQVLQDGQWVEAYGQYENGVLNASKVDGEDESDLDDIDQEGMISWVNTEQSVFEINAHTQVVLNESTRFEDGTKDNLVIGRMVDVELKYAAGRLIGVEVDFEDGEGLHSDKFRVEGLADYTSGQLTLNGIEFIIDANTRFDGILRSKLNGSWVELEGTELNSQFLVREIGAESQDDEIDLEGRVDNNTMWGYSSSDNSLATFNGLWVDIECQRNGDDLTDCRVDQN